MNFFKVTLISAMVTGMTCANVFAHNPSDAANPIDSEEVIAQDCTPVDIQPEQMTEQNGLLLTLTKKGFASLTAALSFPAFISALNLAAKTGVVTDLGTAGITQFLPHNVLSLVLHFINAQPETAALLFGALSAAGIAFTLEGAGQALNRFEKSLSN